MAPKKKGGDSKAEPAAGAAAGPAADAMVDGEADDDDEEVEQGRPLSGARLTDLYCGILKRYYGDAEGVTKIDPAYCIEWAFIPHFYRNFYVRPLQADVVMIATEMELDKDVAERTLREHKGDVVAALNTLVAA